MPRWRNEVEQRVNTVISESWISFDSAFFGQNVIVLALQVAYDFLESAQKILSESQQSLYGQGNRSSRVTAINCLAKARCAAEKSLGEKVPGINRR